jgi:hypothetical protein
LDPIWDPAFVKWNPVGMGGKIEIEAKYEDGKDMTTPQPVTQKPRALESNTSGCFIAHLTCVRQY